MEWLDALILGIVQGLAEYLPVSSSGHLQIFREILGINLPGDEAIIFDIILHAATVLSTIVILWPMFKKLCVSFFTFKKDYDFYYVCKILVSCIPIGIVGVFFKDSIEGFFGGNDLTVVGICLCVTALLLTFAHFSDYDFVKRRMLGSRRGRDIGWVDAFVIGCAQAVAVLPGLSRSGTTIATGIIIGDKREKIASFSFLMVILPIMGEALIDVMKLATGKIQPESISVSALIIGFVAAFAVGCAACLWMLNLVKRGKLVWFALYCVIMGVICLLWQ
ncbi:MAG: undecaprenyl-diphosphate phosphatase [Prevotella sp.]|nr:undecaprenyl-diphosphate phosphatase [Bacteroides sp.]MCM1366190.1 undecaprenyl-diphosphate phosphatase [Prevotella sp.]MCM1436942.1 undecaprenyl-diphosphate phosphatase [Prevotella sp.]